jgi:flavin-dependent dehydrogenase
VSTVTDIRGAVIIGSGPAGWTAALHTARAQDGTDGTRPCFAQEHGIRQSG